MSNLADIDMNELPATQFDYFGKIVLITGGGQGIGRCLAVSFANCGADVIILDIDEEAGGETVRLVRQHGRGSCVFAYADISDESSLAAAVSSIENKLSESGLAVLVNNAAIANAHKAHLNNPDTADFDRVLAVNLRGPYVTTKTLLPWLRQAGGSVVNIASTRAFMSEAQSEGYGSSKGGVVALTHALAMTLAEDKIRVNCVSPGWIAVESWRKGSPAPVDYPAEEHRQHPAGRIGRPADIAAACMFLASADAGFITGVNLTVDGGMTHKMIYN